MRRVLMSKMIDTQVNERHATQNRFDSTFAKVRVKVSVFFNEERKEKHRKRRRENNEIFTEATIDYENEVESQVLEHRNVVYK